MLASCRGRNEDMGTEDKKSGSNGPGCGTTGAASERATAVEACRKVVAPKAAASGFDNILHGVANVDFRHGHRSVVTAATFCR